MANELVKDFKSIVEILADTGKDVQERLTALDMTNMELYTWFSDQDNLDEYFDYCRANIVMANLAGVFEAMMLQCQRGNVQAMKILFQLIDKLKPEVTNNLSLHGISDEQLRLMAVAAQRGLDQFLVPETKVVDVEVVEAKDDAVE